VTGGISRRWAGTAAVAAVAALVVSLMVNLNATPARLTAAVPGDGTALASAPAQVSLTFSAPLDADNTHVAVGTGDGVRVPGGAARVSGRTLVLPVRITGRGTYLVAYHAVLGDGREVSGVTRFVVTSGPPPADVVPPTRSEDWAGAAGTHAHEATDPLSVGLLVANAILIVVVVVMLVRRPRPVLRTSEDAAGHGSAQR
jgi:copper resistance protein C